MKTYNPNVSLTNNRASTYMKKKSIEPKEINEYIIIV